MFDNYPLMLLDHPQAYSFDNEQFKSVLSDARFVVVENKAHWNCFGGYAGEVPPWRGADLGF